MAGVFTGTTGGTLKYWNVTSPSGEVLGRVLPGSGGVRYYGKDHLGSVRVVVDGSGVVKERHDYDAWGGELAGRSVVESVTGRERFTGHAWDAETAWLYAGARLYDPYIGRWMSADPLESKYPGLSPYNYAANMPTMAYDPDGKLIIVFSIGLRLSSPIGPSMYRRNDIDISFMKQGSMSLGFALDLHNGDYSIYRQGGSSRDIEYGDGRNLPLGPGVGTGVMAGVSAGLDGATSISDFLGSTRNYTAWGARGLAGGAFDFGSGTPSEVTMTGINEIINRYISRLTGVSASYAVGWGGYAGIAKRERVCGIRSA